MSMNVAMSRNVVGKLPVKHNGSVWGKLTTIGTYISIATFQMLSIKFKAHFNNSKFVTLQYLI